MIAFTYDTKRVLGKPHLQVLGGLLALFKNQVQTN
jgi:hypothetical protein